MPGFDPAIHLCMLRDVTGQLAAGRPLEEVLTTLTSLLVERANFHSVAIWLYLLDEECQHCSELGDTNPANGRQLHRVSRTEDRQRAESGRLHRLPLTDEFAGRVAREREPIWDNDVGGVGRMLSLVLGGELDLVDPPAWARQAQQEGIRAGVLFPLFVGDEFTGFFLLLAGRPIEGDEVRHLEIFALQAASIIRSTRVYRELERLRDHLALENDYLEQTVREEAGFAGIVGSSAAIKEVLRLVRQVAPTDSTVLLCGETGTGKELVARAIHDASRRAERRMIKVNCGGFSPGLVDSELFGHERGAFTGATQRRIGRFELADRGTLFLDEVAELPPETQVKLLRALQEQEFERVGGERTIRVDVRLVAATHRDLLEEVAAKRFRLDLYYRLNVLPIVIPPLRERPEDIRPLAEHFVAHYARRLSRPLTGLSSESYRRLRRYDWPGNIRELQNVIERASVLATGRVLEVPDPAPDSTLRPGWQRATIAAVERAHIVQTLERTGWRVEGKGGAAQLLGLRPSTLRSRLKRLHIHRAKPHRATSQRQSDRT